MNDIGRNGQVDVDKEKGFDLPSTGSGPESIEGRSFDCLRL